MSPQDKNNTQYKVIWRSKDADGNIVGSYNDDYFIRKIVRDVEFSDGVVNEYAANVTVQKYIHAWVDLDGYSHGILHNTLKRQER